MEDSEQMSGINLLNRLQKDRDELKKIKENVTIKRNVHRYKTSTSTVPKAAFN